ncbi:MAG TPA: sigma-70 family RNA polymerase sigma factor [Pyrinomonadaceae bacterium]|nr:sigma-70 family RNA polymerase sigma factor [Pyrinomonadaceae bacterium]
MPETDAELLEGCRRGDSAAWEALVKRYERLIYAIPRRAGLDEDTASEVFQEVFTTLFEKLDDIAQPDRLHAWLVTTAKRKTWRLIGNRPPNARRAAGGDEDADAELLALPDNAPLPDDMLVRLEQQHQVRAALSALDERCQKLLALLFYRADPPPYSEIAVAIGAPEGSIGPTRARCLQKLLRQLESRER